MDITIYYGAPLDPPHFCSIKLPESLTLGWNEYCFEVLLSLAQAYVRTLDQIF
jgi:hypothetical protein